MSDQYRVEAIRIHRFMLDGTRSFLIKWENYEDCTWEPETNLEGCYDLLQEYLSKVRLEPTNIKKVYGNTANDGFNVANWVSMPRILEVIDIYRNHVTYRTDIKVSEWMQQQTEDQIYLLGLDGHCYVILYLIDQNLGYIADGTNEFLIKQEANEKVRKLTSIPLRGLWFKQQNRVDFCASSSVIIALEFMRAYWKRMEEQIPDEIEVPRVIRLS